MYGIGDRVCKILLAIEKKNWRCGTSQKGLPQLT